MYFIINGGTNAHGQQVYSPNLFSFYWYFQNTKNGKLVMVLIINPKLSFPF